MAVRHMHTHTHTHTLTHRGQRQRGIYGFVTVFDSCLLMSWILFFLSVDVQIKGALCSFGKGILIRQNEINIFI